MVLAVLEYDSTGDKSQIMRPAIQEYEYQCHRLSVVRWSHACNLKESQKTQVSDYMV